MRKLRTVLSTAVAVVVMGVSVLGATTPEFKNLYFKGNDDWTSEVFQFVETKEHTMTTAFQYVKYKGTMKLQITKKVVGIHWAEAKKEVYLTNKYGGIQTDFYLPGKVEKNADRFYRIITEKSGYWDDDLEVKITNYKDNVKAK